MSRHSLNSTVSILSLAFVTLAGCGDDWEEIGQVGPRGGAGGVAGKSLDGAGEAGDEAGGALGSAGADTSAGGALAGEAGALGSDAGGAGSGSGGTENGGSGAENGLGGASAGEGGFGGQLEAGEAGASGEGGARGVLPRSTPAELADESASDYADNRHGLITGGTLAAWLEDWDTRRPAGVSGKLVVLQVVPNVANSVRHVAGNGSSVVSYLVPTSELTQFRDNGLSTIEAEIPDGASADAFLEKYAIDPLNDYVVLTFEQLSNTASSIVQSVGRAWLLLRYWGYPKERLAILNGSVDWNAENNGLILSTEAPATPPNDGTHSVKELRVDNTAIVITVGGLLDIYQGASGALAREDVNIIDARGGAEALGLKNATSTNQTDCANYPTTNKCSPPFEGRLKGAHSVPWPQFLDSAANGFQFFSKATLKDLFDTQADYQPGQLTVQYCRTNQRSMVTGIVAGVILGYPTRFYDTSFIEWSHLAHGPSPLTQVLPENSPFRTDLAALTEHADVPGYEPGDPVPAYASVTWVAGPNYNADDDISTSAVDVHLDATTTDLSVLSDRAYKLE